jgi:hypothetical protein
MGGSMLCEAQHGEQGSTGIRKVQEGKYGSAFGIRHCLKKFPLRKN